MSALQPIKEVQGKGIVVRGNDIDTDRIIPARYMKSITFEGLEKYAFEDARADAKKNGQLHPLDQPNSQDASVMIVNRNFGCGSSREHAPQALWRRGIKAFIGESFAEIFFGNCVAMGIPCLTVLGNGQLEELMDQIEKYPKDMSITIDVEKKRVNLQSGQIFLCALPDGPRQQFLAGTWDALNVLLDAGDKIEATMSRLPYRRNFFPQAPA